jgi:hypothetical protein
MNTLAPGQLRRATRTKYPNLPFGVYFRPCRKKPYLVKFWIPSLKKHTTIGTYANLDAAALTATVYIRTHR